MSQPRTFCMYFFRFIGYYIVTIEIYYVEIYYVEYIL